MMTDAIRNVGLRQMLSARRREMQDDADNLRRIDRAMFLLDEGEYGSCVECQGEISERRLRALPFAVRCQACEWNREDQHERARQIAQRRGSLSLFEVCTTGQTP
jgi:RNA polymerase-binding transcription factor DksA